LSDRVHDSIRQPQLWLRSTDYRVDRLSSRPHDDYGYGQMTGHRRYDLTPGEVARRSGVAVSALHFYEREGLIDSVRTVGNQRRYARDVLRRVAFIRIAQRVGTPLTEIRAALRTLPDNRTPTKADWA